VSVIKATRDAYLAAGLAYAACTEDRTSTGDPLILGARMRIAAKAYWRAVQEELCEMQEREPIAVPSEG
jgi:hypothetical protein